MLLLIEISLFICLGIVAFQDFKYRGISWQLIPLLLAGFIGKALMENSGSILYTSILLNIGFVIFQLVLSTIIISILNKKVVNLYNTYIGLGDILFVAVLCTAFSTVNFIVFYILSSVLALISMVAGSKLMKKEIDPMPYAGAMSVILVVFAVINKIYPTINFYNDDFLVEIISAYEPN